MVGEIEAGAHGASGHGEVFGVCQTQWGDAGARGTFSY